MVPTAVRGPVVGPACRACASESERGWGRQGGGVGFFYKRGEAVRTVEKKSRPALYATTPIYGEVGAAIFA